MFGDKVTFDIVTAYRGDLVEGPKYTSKAILFYDLATSWLELIPLESGDHTDVIKAIRLFAMGGTIKRAYSDRGGELIKACNFLNIEHHLSQPGRPQTNSLIERQVQVVVRGTRALLAASGPQQHSGYTRPNASAKHVIYN